MSTDYNAFYSVIAITVMLGSRGLVMNAYSLQPDFFKSTYYNIWSIFGTFYIAVKNFQIALSATMFTVVLWLIFKSLIQQPTDPSVTTSTPTSPSSRGPREFFDGLL